MTVPAGGYRWWYVDALSEDGRHGLTIIAFIGSVFSPYYAWSGRGDPLNHCTINVALYGAAGHRWAMTERGRRHVRQEEASFTVGPSSLAWEGGVLAIRFDEVTAPIPARLRGTVRLHPCAVLPDTFALDTAARHIWRPIAPRADVEVTLEHPALSWRGQGYFDTNAGSEPLEDGFIEWDWTRAHRERDTLIFYDVIRRGGEAARMALRINGSGGLERIEGPPSFTLPRTFWRMPRTVRGDPADPPRLLHTLEDAPFYSRSQLEGRYDGERADIMHESLSLDRLRSPVVRVMLPFRMPRVFW